MDPAIACYVFLSKRHVFESSQGGAAELTNRRDAAAASLRFRRFVGSAALPWLLSKTCLLERKTPHAMARSIITPRFDGKKLDVRIASWGLQSPRCHVSNRHNHHLVELASAEVPHQMAPWVIRLAIKTTGNGRHQVTIHLTEFLSFFLDISGGNYGSSHSMCRLSFQKARF